MFFSALYLRQKLLLATAAAALLPLVILPASAQPDPPAQGGRISYISGNVSFQPVGSEDWGQAAPNLPLGPGDRIATDDDSRAEIQIGQTFVRIGPNSDVTLVDSTPEGLYFGVGQGSIHLHSNGLWDGQSIYVNTPSGSSTLSRGGDLRVDVWPDQPAALFSDFASPEIITGAGGFEQEIGTGQSFELVGTNPVVPQWTDPGGWDDLDRWSSERDQQIARSQSYRYVSPEIPGAYELDAAGTWLPDSPYGPVWFPNNVQPGWAPYRNGHWVNHQPWGWVWVEDEQWGYAPFHYGRWVVMDGRWGWVPGPPAEHPVWSPALVVFAGGAPGVSVWFPLGPGEPYRPWYPCSPRYVDRVNISNIRVTPRIHVQTTYVNFNFGGVVFANRSAGLIAVRNEDFAAGRRANQSVVHVDVHIVDRIQMMNAPEPRPTRESFIGHPPAHVVRVAAARPMLINASGKVVMATPNARPVEPPVRAAPVVRELPGHKAIAPPPNAPKPTGKFVPPPARVEPQQQPQKPSGSATPRIEVHTLPPAEPKPGMTPVMPPAVRPAPQPAPQIAPKTPPVPAGKPVQPVKPPPPAQVKPVTPPRAADKPGAPPARTDKDKKNDKDKKDKPNDEKKPQ
jgi:hypothetical protein